MAILENIFDDKAESIPLDIVHQPVEYIPPYGSHDVEPHISFHVLNGIFTLETLELIDYIKYCKLIVIIDSANTHNFIH